MAARASADECNARKGQEVGGSELRHTAAISYRDKIAGIKDCTAGGQTKRRRVPEECGMQDAPPSSC